VTSSKCALPAPLTSKSYDISTPSQALSQTSIRARVYQPVAGAPAGGSPLIIMYHEGGWSMGDLSDEDLNCRMFSKELGAVCVNVEYRYAIPFL
jgi:acetyl esterase/lipase